MTYIRTFIAAVMIGTSALAQTPRPAPVATPPPPSPLLYGQDSAGLVQAQALDVQARILDAQALAQEAQARAQDAQARTANLGLFAPFEFGIANGTDLFAQVTPGVAAKGGRGIGAGIGGYGGGFGNNDENTYQAGQRALDNHNWDQALNDFSRVTTGPRADGALYWKAYTLNKLNRRDDAQAAIAELRRSYATSRWLEDASALELQIRQASGQTVAPESESDEELKLLALNGLMQSDPDRALPLIEGLLKGTQSPKLKKQAVYVLAQSSSPRARTLLEQVARGGNNPDLQSTAISYLTAQRRGQSNNSSDLLWEIYNSSTDTNVKRQILNSFASSNDRDHLLQVASTEKATDLRLAAIQHLGGNSFSADLLKLATTERDPNLRRAAIQQLASTNENSDALVSLYAAEQDATVKQAIVDSLGNRNNAKALVTLAKTEKDPQMLRRIVQRLTNMKSPDAAAYFEELLKK
jgi:hypothetical protein